MDEFAWSKYFYSRSLTIDVAGIPHTFGFGGLHGAPTEPVHLTGGLYHVDVNNYYPSMLIAWDLVTRAATNDNFTKVYMTRKKLKYKQTHAASKEEAKKYKKMQLPYKKMLNALSGAMKDRNNPAYDPRNNNCMCINGQLMLLDLIDKLEAIPGFRLVQSNTDGLIVQLPDTDEAFGMMDDICFEWESRCSTEKCGILLELDTIHEIYQKDVNSYLWVDSDGGVERIGTYIKELSPIDNDFPILNKALVEYMVNKTPVEDTIGQCNKLIEFQKLVKLSNKYKWVEHENGAPRVDEKGTYHYNESTKYTYKSYRVFASRRETDGRLLKCGGKTGKPQKFANTSDHCFIFNGDVTGVKVPPELDRQWYIDLAKKRLKHFGL
jgi:DNA polymerase